jgi:hypothetical protein
MRDFCSQKNIFWTRVKSTSAGFWAGLHAFSPSLGADDVNHFLVRLTGTLTSSKPPDRSGAEGGRAICSSAIREIGVAAE